MHGDQLGACGHQCPFVGTSRHFATPEFGRYRSHSGPQPAAPTQLDLEDVGGVEDSRHRNRRPSAHTFTASHPHAAPLAARSPASRSNWRYGPAKTAAARHTAPLCRRARSIRRSSTATAATAPVSTSSPTAARPPFPCLILFTAAKRGRHDKSVPRVHPSSLPLRWRPAGGTFEGRHMSRQTKTISRERLMAATRIDCDIHPAVGGTRTTLLPYLDDHWKEQVVSRAIDGLDLTSYPPNMPLSGRADWRPAKGKPGSDLAMVQRGAFDQLGASHAICNVLYGAQAVYDPYMAAAFCKAINDWIAAEWLAQRFAAARLDRGADAGAGSRDRGNRTPRRRSQVRFGAGAGAGRELCWDGGITGRSIRPPRNTNCRSRSMPAASTAARRVRSAGRPIATNIIWPRRRRFRPRCSA